MEKAHRTPEVNGRSEAREMGNHRKRTWVCSLSNKRTAFSSQRGSIIIVLLKYSTQLIPPKPRCCFWERKRGCVCVCGERAQYTHLYAPPSVAKSCWNQSHLEDFDNCFYSWNIAQSDLFFWRCFCFGLFSLEKFHLCISLGITCFYKDLVFVSQMHISQLLRRLLKLKCWWLSSAVWKSNVFCASCPENSLSGAHERFIRAEWNWGECSTLS